MVTTDLAHGGRWTSLRVGTRERDWLWHRPDPARDTVRPGDAFVDAGGLEECLPTVRGVPDHGALWSRPWSPAGAVSPAGPAGAVSSARPSGAVGPTGPAGAVSPAGPAGAVSSAGPAGAANSPAPAGAANSPAPAGAANSPAPAGAANSPAPAGAVSPDPRAGAVSSAGTAGDVGEVDADGFTLARTLRDQDGAVVAEYRLTGEPGRPFVWAAHALLELSVAARLEAPDGTPVRVYDTGTEPWAGETWPLPLADLGPSDGTAVGAILTGCPSVTVIDGTDRLTFTLTAEGQPVSTALWRNLGGFGGYRSIGVEPMLGRVFDLATAGPGDAAIIPASGVCEWRLEIR